MGRLTGRTGRTGRRRWPVAGAAALDALRARVDDLEGQLAECRRQHLRVAELTDVVQELLLPLAQQDQEKVAEVLRRYTDELG